jgi:hypothetical protein
MIKNLTNTVLFMVSAFFAQAQTSKTLSKADYRDKTLAMILGSIGGVTTGYEYLRHYDTPDGFYAPGATQSVPPMPLFGLPDNWFILLNGTLGGTTKDEYNYGSWFSTGRMNSDDDQHIDFFNQFLLNKYGPSIAYEEVKKEWMAKNVSDFGAGHDAIAVMRDKNLMAPQCGKRDHGDYGHWLAECYIEHETMGAAFPGMPKKSAEYTEKLSHLTGEGDNVQWGYYWSAAHALAFFESDIRVVAQKALDILPANCRPREMYDICLALKAKYPNDWRAAVKELWTDHWSAPYAVGYSSIMLAADPNNGTVLLSILYGNNDYLTTLKIASLAGGDGDCTASTVGGLLGIIKGMAGTPAEFKDRIYVNGKGVWINDTAHAFSIKKDYKIQWTYDEIVDMYQQNAESMILAFGGSVSTNGYTIPVIPSSIPQIGSTNWGFENGDLTGWKTWTSGGTSSIWAEKQCDANTQACFAATGKYKGTINTNSPTSEAKLYQTITGLKPGATYKIEGRIHTASGREARLYVDNYGGPYKYTSIWKGVSPFPFLYLYVTMGSTNTSLDIGLHAVPTTNGSTWCNVDDIILTEMENAFVPIKYEAENALVNKATVFTGSTASGGKYVGGIDATGSYVEFQNVMATYSGEHIVRIYVSNAGSFATHKIWVNGIFVGLLEHSDTGPWGAFSANANDAYVKLNKGANTIRIQQNANSAEIDFIELVSPYGTSGKPADDEGLVSGGIYKIVNKKSNKVLDVTDGNIANGSLIIQNTYTGATSQYFEITKTQGVYYMTPVNSNEAVEILGAATNNGDKAGLWGYWAGEGQQWAILDAGEGYFKVLNHKSGKALDVAGGSLADGATVFQYDYLNGDNQKWRFDFVGTATSDLPHLIPGLIQAEAFSDSSGIRSESTTDVGAGKDVAFIENGDWMEYRVDVQTAGTYSFSFRVSSATTGGKISLKSDGVAIGDITFGGTAGWQAWQTVKKDMVLTAGLHTLRLECSGGAGSLFNVNWINVQHNTVTDLGSSELLRFTGIQVRPNPSLDVFYISSPNIFEYSLFDALGNEMESGSGENGFAIGQGLKQGVYVLKINSDLTNRVFKLIKK